jgi:hypothetical protein
LIKDFKKAQEQAQIDEGIENFETVPNEKTLVSLAREFNTTPEKLEKAIKKNIEADEADEQKTASEKEFEKQKANFKETHTDIDIEKLLNDEDFLDYGGERRGTLSEIYESYVKYNAKLKEKTADEIREKYVTKELLSTGTGKGSGEESTYNLTENQKNLAKSNGMSYKEYADLLKYA